MKQLVDAIALLRRALDGGDLAQVADARNQLEDIAQAASRDYESLMDPEMKLPLMLRLSDAARIAAEADKKLKASGKFKQSPSTPDDADAVDGDDTSSPVKPRKPAPPHMRKVLRARKDRQSRSLSQRQLLERLVNVLERAEPHLDLAERERRERAAQARTTDVDERLRRAILLSDLGRTKARLARTRTSA